MSITHVMGALSPQGAGVAKAVWEMSAAQHRIDAGVARVRLLGLDDPQWQDQPPVGSPPPYQACPYLGPAVPGYSPALRSALDESCEGLAVIHSHGLWMYPNWAAESTARRRKAPLIVSPHGMLCPWSFRHSAWKKLPAFHLWEKRGLRSAACLLAASQVEADHIRAFNFGVPTAMIPWGIDLNDFPDPCRPEPTELIQGWKSLTENYPELDDGRRVLFLGRLHRVKAPEHLIKAWANLSPQPKDARLIFAGPGDRGMLARLRRLSRSLGIVSRVTFLPPVGGAQKSALLRRSSVLVLCSHNENFGFVVLEALAGGTPVIASDRTPWSILDESGAGWTYRFGSEGLTRALKMALELPARELAEMGLRGRKLVEDQFQWKTLARRMINLYQWTLGLADPSPDLIL